MDDSASTPRALVVAVVWRGVAALGASVPRLDVDGGRVGAIGGAVHDVRHGIHTGVPPFPSFLRHPPICRRLRAGAVESSGPMFVAGSWFRTGESPTL